MIGKSIRQACSGISTGYSPLGSTTVNITFAVTTSANGTFNWVCPSDVSSVTAIRCWGAGGAGQGILSSTGAGGGGAGGQYAQKSNVAVTANTSYAVVVAGYTAGNTGVGATGKDTSFNGTTVLAKGGAGSYGGVTAGSTSGGIGTVVYAGGNGAAAFTAANYSGPGGGGAGTTGAGSASSNGVAGGLGASLSGGNGGAGRLSSAAGLAGSSYGGGGGGARRTTSGSNNGGSGGAGRIEIVYNTAQREIIPRNSNMSDWSSNHANISIVGGVLYCNANIASGVLLATRTMPSSVYPGTALTGMLTFSNMTGLINCIFYVGANSATGQAYFSCGSLDGTDVTDGLQTVNANTSYAVSSVMTLWSSTNQMLNGASISKMAIYYT